MQPQAVFQPVPDLPPAGESVPEDLPATPVRRVWYWEAAPEWPAANGPSALSSRDLGAIAAAALALAAVAWWLYRRRFAEMQFPEREYRGYSYEPLSPPDRDDTALIPASERRQLVWRIDHFVSEEPTRRLDLPLTVDATAQAAGFVELRFEPAAYEREIWFWLDVHLRAQSAPRTAAAQLIAALRASGLDAQEGAFTDAPDRVDWPGRRAYNPENEEGHGLQAIVAIFTSGEGLALRLENALYRERTERLLRSLQRWPRLCFVDCSESGATLAPLLRKHELRLQAVSLDGLAEWLGGVQRPNRAPLALNAPLTGDALAWAGAAALGGGHADAPAAQTLRAAMGFHASPWLVDRILSEARDPASRRRWINRLLRMDPLVDGLPPAGSPAARAVQWWWRRFEDDSLQKESQENPLAPWRDSLASRRYKLEQALLTLAVAPEKAAGLLAELADERLRDEIRERLSEFAAADDMKDVDAGDRICFTWKFSDLSSKARHRLRQLGFGPGRL